MNLTLDTVSSPVVDGRCAGCGRFISRDTSHFHSTEKRRFRGPPRAHIWVDGGAMVTRCDDLEQARQIVMRRYRYTHGADEQEAEERFPPGSGEVQRGRMGVQQPGGDYAWCWWQLPMDAKGFGITTAVVWNWSW